jgi:hypothetical protein
MIRAEIVLGCRMRDVDNPYIYGNCMKGWIYGIRVEGINDYTDDSDFAANHICTTSTDCNLCAEIYASGCFEDLDLSNYVIEEWDTNSNS